MNLHGCLATDPTQGDDDVSTQVQAAGDDGHIDVADVSRRLKAIFIGSMGNLVEWYDFYAYTAFALYFAPKFFPQSDPVVQQLNVAVLFAATFLMRPFRSPRPPARRSSPRRDRIAA